VWDIDVLKKKYLGKVRLPVDDWFRRAGALWGLMILVIRCVVVSSAVGIICYLFMDFSYSRSRRIQYRHTHRHMQRGQIKSSSGS
jgi:lipid-A-disaccharide synthase-like uncharacterized protein